MKSIVRSLAVEMALQQRATGRRIAQLRERAHLTQEAAADRAGVTLRAYQKWEAGGGIQFANLKKLADALNTTVDEITGQAETPSPFRVSDQLDGIVEQFSARVDEVDARLDRIEAAITQLAETVETQRIDNSRHLEDQTAVLELIKSLLAIGGEEPTIQERLVGMLRAAQAQAAGSSGSTSRS